MELEMLKGNKSSAPNIWKPASEMVTFFILLMGGTVKGLPTEEI